MFASEKIKCEEVNGEMRAFGEDSICKKDILNMLEKEIRVCRTYNIMSLRMGLEVAYTLVNALPMNYKSVVIRPLVISMLDEQVKINKNYSLHDNIKGLEHASGMVRCLVSAS